MTTLATNATNVVNASRKTKITSMGNSDTVRTATGQSENRRCWYELDPQASVLYAVEGPEGYKIEDIDYENLPDDFEYVSDDRWEWFERYTHIVSLFPDGRVEHRGVGKGLGKTLHNLFEMGGME